jgi:hypothetical protein
MSNKGDFSNACLFSNMDELFNDQIFSFAYLSIMFTPLDYSYFFWKFVSLCVFFVVVFCEGEGVKPSANLSILSAGLNIKSENNKIKEYSTGS